MQKIIYCTNVSVFNFIIIEMWTRISIFCAVILQIISICYSSWNWTTPTHQFDKVQSKLEGEWIFIKQSDYGIVAQLVTRFIHPPLFEFHFNVYTISQLRNVLMPFGRIILYMENMRLCGKFKIFHFFIFSLYWTM